MRRHRSILTLTTLVILSGLLSADRVAAQIFNNPGRSYGVGIGIGISSGPRYGYGYGPYVGGYPFNYNGFYGNGMSMYGPPVPTYAPVPGTFGGSDYRVNQNAPFFGTGLGWYGYRSPSPRPPANLNYNPPANNGEPPLLDGSVQGGGAGNSMIVEVRVPIEKATVFVNDVVTRQDGAVRLFASPALTPGQTYKYDVRAEWIIDGRKTSLTRTVKGKAGERVVADFMQ